MSDAPAARSVWLRSAVWDGFWMHSGVWLLAPLGLLAVASVELRGLLIVSSLLLWLSHRFATTYNAFCTPAYRHLVREQYGRFLVAPLVILGTTFAFMFAPEDLLGLDTWNKVQLLASFFFAYNVYHFAVQHYGIITIYRIRAGQGHGDWLKRWERPYCLLVGGASVVLAQVCHGAQIVEDSFLYALAPRSAFAALYAAFQLLVPLGVAFLTVAFVVAEFRHERPSVPKLIYVGAVALQGCLGYWLDPLSFLILWGVQHWLVSVALTAHMAQNDRPSSSLSSRWFRFWQRLNRGFWPAVFVLAVTSVVLTPLFDYAVHPEALSMGPKFLEFLAPLLQSPFWLNVLISLNFATVFIHFLMDRAIFRFSNSSVRKVTGPLLFQAAG